MRKMNYIFTSELDLAIKAFSYSKPSYEMLRRLDLAVRAARSIEIITNNRNYPTPEQIADWQKRRASGEKRKHIAIGSGFSERTIGRFTKNPKKAT